MFTKFGLQNRIIIGNLLIGILSFGQKMNKNLLARSKDEPVRDWSQLPSDRVLGQPTGLGIDSKSNLKGFHSARAITAGSKNIDPQNTIFKINYSRSIASENSSENKYSSRQSRRGIQWKKVLTFYENHPFSNFPLTPPM